MKFMESETLELKKSTSELKEGIIFIFCPVSQRLISKKWGAISLRYLKENPHISKRELSDKIGISTTAIDKNISTLKKKGLLKRVGPHKGGHWEIGDDQ